MRLLSLFAAISTCLFAAGDAANKVTWFDNDCNRYTLLQRGAAFELKTSDWTVRGEKVYNFPGDLTIFGSVNNGKFTGRIGTDPPISLSGSMTPNLIAGTAQIVGEPLQLVLVRSESAANSCRAVPEPNGQPKKVTVAPEVPSGPTGSELPIGVGLQDEQGSLVAAERDRKVILREGDQIVESQIRQGQSFTMLLWTLAAGVRHIRAEVQEIGNAQAEVTGCEDGNVSRVYLDVDSLRASAGALLPVKVRFWDSNRIPRRTSSPTSVTLNLADDSVGRRLGESRTLPAGQCVYQDAFVSQKAGTAKIQATVDIPNTSPSEQRTLTWTYQLNAALVAIAGIAALISGMLLKPYRTRKWASVGELALTTVLGVLLYLAAFLLSVNISTGAAIVNIYAAIFIGGCAGLLAVRSLELLARRGPALEH